MSIIAHDGIFLLENALFRRIVRVDDNGITSVSVFNKLSQREYLKRSDCAEFSFMLNGKLISSYAQSEVHILDGNIHETSGMLQFLRHRITTGRQGAEVLRLEFSIVGFNAELAINYELWPDLCGCRKWLEIRNCGNTLLHVNKLTIEALNVCAGEYVDQEYYRNNGFIRCTTAFATTGTDDMLHIHNPRLKEGLIFGLDIPMPLCYFLAYPRWPSGISCGYSQSTLEFNKYLHPGENFSSGAVLMLLYLGEHSTPAVCNCFRKMIRRTLPDLPEPPGVMYCTWLPFLKNIDEKLIDELSVQAAELGFQSLVLDDGWFTMNNWEVDKEKFPRGLNIIAETIKKRGLKFGLWINLGTDYGAPGSHPEDNCIVSSGKVKSWGATQYACRCMASGQQELASAQLLELARSYHVDYFKIDFSNIISPYGFIPPGCSAENHTHHRNAGDAPYEQYRSMYNMRKAIKAEFPTLEIDFSFECFGTERPGISALQYSELHHASNFNTAAAFDNARQIRLALYQYAAMLPPERILGSLICLQGENVLENLLTAFITSPLVAGDLRTIPPTTRQEIAAACRAFNELNQETPLTHFALLNGGNTSWNQWDGFARYADDGRGFIACFANDSGLFEVTVIIPDTPQELQLILCDMVTGIELGRYSGAEMAMGVKISLDGKTCRGILIHSHD